MPENTALGEDVLFHEMYNIYYRIVANLIESAERSPLSIDKIEESVKKSGFGETDIEFFKKFHDCDIPIFYKNNDGTYGTPLKFTTRSLSLTERRWLASIADDERMGLFLSDVEIENLKVLLGDAEPLYRKKDFCIVDGANDPDPFSDALYRKNFRTLLDALRRKKLVRIFYRPHYTRESMSVVEPTALQYSRKDDKFRLLCAVHYGEGGRNARNIVMNVARIVEAEVLSESPLSGVAADSGQKMKTAVMKISRERDTPERAMVHFSNYECLSRLDSSGEIIMNMTYNAGDELEVLIRVLSFGPLVHVLGPHSLVLKIKERLKRQASLKSFSLQNSQ